MTAVAEPAAPAPATRNAEAFFSAIFPDVPEGMRILLWTLPGQASHWPEDTTAAAARAVELRAGHNVYVGVGLRPAAGLAPGKRGGADDVTALAGVWADVDIAGDGHAKKAYPPDEAAAVELLDKLPLAPTMIVHSGGGLHAWWAFREPWVFDGPGERAKAKALAKGWQDVIRRHAAAKGWAVDSTHDIARVLRVPGTWNRKTDPPRPVVIRSTPGTTYDPGDFEPFVGDAEALPAAAEAGPLRLDANAQPPWPKLHKLFSDDVLAGLTFDRRRPELPDQSASAYDFSLTNYLVRAGFTDQEITDTLVYSRHTAGAEAKLRQDYYAGTIGKVRATVRAEPEDSPPTASSPATAAAGPAAGGDREAQEGKIAPPAQEGFLSAAARRRRRRAAGEEAGR